MLALRGGAAMASHGRHVLLENVKNIAARRRAKRGSSTGYRPPPSQRLTRTRVKLALAAVLGARVRGYHNHPLAARAAPLLSPRREASIHRSPRASKDRAHSGPVAPAGRGIAHFRQRLAASLAGVAPGSVKPPPA